MCVCVCVCVCERERERDGLAGHTLHELVKGVARETKRERERGEGMHNIQ